MTIFQNFQIAIVLLAVVFVAAKPAPQFLAAYTAPATYAASPYATAVVSREFHGGVSAPYIASPFAAAYSAPLVAAPAAYTAFSPYYL